MPFIQQMRVPTGTCTDSSNFFCRSETHRKLRSKQVLTFGMIGVAATGQAVLELGLDLAAETVADAKVQSPAVAIPSGISSGRIAKTVLIPAGGKPGLWRDLVAGLDIASEGLHPANGGHIEASGH